MQLYPSIPQCEEKPATDDLIVHTAKDESDWPDTAIDSNVRVVADASSPTSKKSIEYIQSFSARDNSDLKIDLLIEAEHNSPGDSAIQNVNVGPGDAHDTMASRAYFVDNSTSVITAHEAVAAAALTHERDKQGLEPDAACEAPPAYVPFTVSGV